MKARPLGEDWLEVPGWCDVPSTLESCRGGDTTALKARRCDLGDVALGAGDGAAGEVHLRVRLDGPDLDDVLEKAGLSLEALADTLHDAPLRVAFLSFLPGFAYIEGLPACLRLPRRDTPRKRIPQGSLALGGGYIGVYPCVSPGGWNLIGTCDDRLFDPFAWPPTELLPGRRVVIDPC